MKAHFQSHIASTAVMQRVESDLYKLYCVGSSLIVADVFEKRLKGLLAEHAEWNVVSSDAKITAAKGLCSAFVKESCFDLLIDLARKVRSQITNFFNTPTPPF